MVMVNGTEQEGAVVEKPLPYGDVAEIVEVTARAANEYIAHGYTLLGIYNRAIGRATPKGDFYVAKGPAYVLGRPASVESWVVGQRS